MAHLVWWWRELSCWVNHLPLLDTPSFFFPQFSCLLPCTGGSTSNSYSYTHISQCLWLISLTHTSPQPKAAICLSTLHRKSKRPGGPYLLVLFLPLFIRTWLHLDNRCLLINFAPVLTLGCIPSLSLRRKKSRPGCAVICYAVKRLMDVHLVFESSSYSSGACLLCTSRLQ